MADTTFSNVVDGDLVDAASGETYDVIDPTNGEVYATAPMSGQEDLDRAFGAADKAFEQWGRMTPRDRAAPCSRSPRPSTSGSRRSTPSSARTPASRSA